MCSSVIGDLLAAPCVDVWPFVLSYLLTNAEMDLRQFRIVFHVFCQIF